MKLAKFVALFGAIAQGGILVYGFMQGDFAAAGQFFFKDPGALFHWWMCMLALCSFQRGLFSVKRICWLRCYGLFQSSFWAISRLAFMRFWLFKTAVIPGSDSGWVRKLMFKWRYK